MKKLFTLVALAVMAFAAQANVLSVCQDTWYSGVYPVYGLWYDTPGQSQTIYPADMLTEMEGGQITEMTFLTLSTIGENEYGDFSDYTIKFSEGELQLALKEVDQLGFTEEVAITGAEVVATTVPEYGAQLLTFVLDEPFQYNGGNLLVEVTITTPGGYGTTYFLGAAMVDANDNDIYTPSYYVNYGYSGDLYSSGLSSFLPAIDFTYEEGGEEPPVDPEDPHMTGYWLVQINADGELIYTELFPGQNGDFVNVDDVTYPEFYEICGFYFMIDGVAYGAPEDMTLANLGDADQNPLVPGENTYYVGVGYSYTFGVHFIYDQDTMEFMGYSAYVAKGGRVDVDEVAAGKTVAGVRYFNVAGQEMQEANGMTIVVTTYTDGTTSAVKVIK